MSIPVKFSIKTRSQSRTEDSSVQEESITSIKEEEFLENAEDQLSSNSSTDLSLAGDLVETFGGSDGIQSSEDLGLPERDDPTMVDRGPVITPPKFTGGFGSNVEEYLGQFERVSRANGWNEAKQLVILPCYLEGAALKWYENLEQKLGNGLTWQLVKDNMREAFQVVAWDEQLEYRLRLRVQGEDEPVENYVQDITNLCSKVDNNMAEKTKIKHVLRGLLPSLLEKVMMMDNETLDGLMRNIRKVQTARFMAGQRVDHFMVETPKALEPVKAPATGSTSKLESQLENLTTEFSKLSMRLLEQQTTSVGRPHRSTTGGGRQEERGRVEGHRYVADERGRDHYHNRNYRGSGPQGAESGQERTDYYHHGRREFRGPARGRTSDGRVVCFKCNRVGHFAIACQNQGNERGGR